MDNSILDVFSSIYPLGSKSIILCAKLKPEFIYSRLSNSLLATKYNVIAPAIFFLEINLNSEIRLF